MILPPDKPFANVVVRIAFDGDGNALGKPRAQALSRRTVKFDIDRIFRQHDRHRKRLATSLESMVPTTRFILITSCSIKTFSPLLQGRRRQFD